MKAKTDKFMKMVNLDTLKNIKLNKDFKAQPIFIPSYNFFTGPVRSNTTSNFFAPYRGLKDIAKTIAAPIYAPLAWGMLSAAVAVVTAVSAIASLGYLLVSGGAAVAGKKEAASGYLSISKQLGILAGLSAIGTAVMAVMAAVSLPENLLKLGTRSFTSVKEAVSKPKEEVPSYPASTAYTF